MHDYFAYGSNLDPVQMKRRCPGSEAITRAVLQGHRLCYPVASHGDWAGGVAGIEPAVGQDVHGVVYRVTDSDLAALDEYEAIDIGMYRRDRVEVIAEAGQVMTVWTYFAIPEASGPTPPSRRYITAIARGARHHGLPQAYIAALEATDTND